jgi:catechol 2,3-dioxygenase-like lactoylglutathione lyase family enzyme
MRLTHTRLLVNDMDRQFAFWAHQVGLRPRFGEVESVYHEFETGAGTLALFDAKRMAKSLGRKSAPAARAGDRAVVCLAVDDVDAVYRMLKAKGVRFVRGPHNEAAWMMRVAQFRDPEGNLVEVSQDLKRA